MKTTLIILLLVLFLGAEVMTMQNGNNFNGTDDITLYKDQAKSASYFCSKAPVNIPGAEDGYLVFGVFGC